MSNKTQKIRTITHQLERFMALYGYESQDVPIIDNAELFLTKAGDQIIERLFIFERRGQQWALRPEFTASATYQYINSNRTDIKRWQYHGAIFEDQRLQQKNSYQRYSMGAELFGLGDINADAEIISMATKGLIQQGIQDWQLTIGHMGLMRQLLSSFNLDDRTLRFLLSHRQLLRDQGKEDIMRKLGQYLPSIKADVVNDIALPEQISDEADTHEMVDTFIDASRGRDTMGGRSRGDISHRILRKRRQSTQKSQIIKAIDFLDTWVHLQGEPNTVIKRLTQFVSEKDNPSFSQIIHDLKRLLHLLEVYGLPSDQITLKPDLAREWDYYTGVVFEVISSDGKLLCGGGRYDDLTRLFGGKDLVPAIGFAYDIDNISEKITFSEYNTTYELQCAVEQMEVAIEWANLLRDNNIQVQIAISTDQCDTCLHIDADDNINYRDEIYSKQAIQPLIDKLS